jgi:hypothetical protein
MPAPHARAIYPPMIRAEPSRAEPSRAEPSRAEPSRAEPSRAERRVREVTPPVLNLFFKSKTYDTCVIMEGACCTIAAALPLVTARTAIRESRPSSFC